MISVGVHCRGSYLGSSQRSLSASSACKAVAHARQAFAALPLLASWRGQGIDQGRGWGDAGPSCEVEAPGAQQAADIPLATTLAGCARQVLVTADPTDKAALTHRAWALYHEGELPVGVASAPSTPGRPAQPKLVPARQVPTLKQSRLPLNATLLHTLAHIELNAINLAWDTVARFSHLLLPEAFYADFARVAEDESRHFGWCIQRLNELGCSYGDLPAHNLLWEGAEASSGDLHARLAIVPMSQEARGLDAGPRLTQRLRSYNDHRSAAIVERITAEETAHVAVGAYWFAHVCTALDINAGDVFRSNLARLCPDLLKGQFNHSLRSQAGLHAEWYDPSRWPSSSEQLPLESLVPSDTSLSDTAGKTSLEQVRQRLTEMLQLEMSANAV